MWRRTFFEVSIPNVLFLCVLLAVVVALPGNAIAQVQVKDYNEINSVYGLPGLPVDLGDYFGAAMTQLGDLDGDGISELVAGARDDVWIMFPDSRGLVKSYTRINSTSGGFTALLESGDSFGWSVEGIGDLDDDGIADLAVGAYGDDDGGDARGAVYILFLNADGTVKSHQKISATQGGFTGTLDNSDFFGSSLGELGDLDGDGVEDLAVGAFGDDDGGSSRGALWILFLNTDGTVKSYQKISDTAGNFTGTLDDVDYFANSITNLGDIDGDTVIDIAVGARNDDDGASGAGAVWVLFMNTDGTVKAHQKISRLEGNFSFVLESGQAFGEDLASPGDIDGDGTNDLVVGAPNQHSTYSYNYQGMVFSLLLNSDGTVKSYAKIDRTSFAGNLPSYGYFGYGITAAGDVDGDGIGDLAVAAYRDSECGSNVGSVYILPLASDGSLKSYYNNKINGTMGGLIGMMFDYEYFGSSVAGIGDIDGNGVGDMVVGATGDKERYSFVEGSIWVLLLDTLGTVEDYTKISAATGWPDSDLGSYSEFGCAVDSVGDLDGDGYTDLVVGASHDYDGFTEAGAVWVLFLDSDHTVKSHQKISSTSGGFTGILGTSVHFGSAVAGLGDLDGDGVEDIAVGSSGDNSNMGSLWVLFLNTDGTVKSHHKIGQSTGGFTGTLDYSDLFGSAVVNAGDIDGDGVTDLAVGAPLDDDGVGYDKGAMWVLFLDTDGTVQSHQKISALSGGFPSAELDTYDRLGSSLAAIGDQDGNGTPDLAASVPYDDEGGGDRGAFWTLFLKSDGTVASYAKIGDYSGNFSGTLYSYERFGSALAFLGDLDGDGFGDIAVGAHLDDNYEYSYNARGSVWTLRLEQEPASCAVSPASIDFGIIDYGTYVDTTFTVVNTGGVELTGTFSEVCDDFSIISGGGAYSIGPDSAHVVTVRYEPVARGVHGCVLDTGDDICSDVDLSGTTSTTVSVVTEPAGLSISVDGAPFVAPYQFVTGVGYSHGIGTDSLQVEGDTTYVFSGWSDGGFATHSFTAGAEDTVLTASFELLTSWGSIASIVDVPDDQGGWARMHIRRSVYDAPGEATYPITGYNIYRRVDEQAMVAGILETGKRLSKDDISSLERSGTERPQLLPAEESGVIAWDGRIFVNISGSTLSLAPPGLWEVVTSFYATQQDRYIQLVPTQADSSGTIPWEVFYISAHTTTPAVYFESPPDSGYSVDNIAPGVPLALAVAYNTGSGNALTWDISPEPDFQYYRIYRGGDPDFVPVPGEEVHSTATPYWTDTEIGVSGVYYKITALDDSGNESDSASPVTVTGDDLPSVPKAFALRQNVPNPFNPSTTIRFDLPRAVRVSLAVYNVKGELIATLADGEMTEGRKEVIWNARDVGGNAVASGIYFYRLVAGDFVQTKKMVLLR
ncbi:MAG: FG-GAP repeat protein [Bacteroidales bacterium]|nr:FG-GAP repeat protein [Candidatus Latescibacterota bacterium]